MCKAREAHCGYHLADYGIDRRGRSGSLQRLYMRVFYVAGVCLCVNALLHMPPIHTYKCRHEISAAAEEKLAVSVAQYVR
jgi:hypothetical protein